MALMSPSRSALMHTVMNVIQQSGTLWERGLRCRPCCAVTIQAQRSRPAWRCTCTLQSTSCKMSRNSEQLRTRLDSLCCSLCHGDSADVFRGSNCAARSRKIQARRKRCQVPETPWPGHGATCSKGWNVTALLATGTQNTVINIGSSWGIKVAMQANCARGTYICHYQGLSTCTA
jgi:hypothetical protein